MNLNRSETYAQSTSTTECMEIGTLRFQLNNISFSSSSQCKNFSHPETHSSLLMIVLRNSKPHTDGRFVEEKQKKLKTSNIETPSSMHIMWSCAVIAGRAASSWIISSENFILGELLSGSKQTKKKKLIFVDTKRAVSHINCVNKKSIFGIIKNNIRNLSGRVQAKD